MAIQLLSDHEIEENVDQLKPHIVVSASRSALERFLDSFFQPANIKWMLIVGAAIVLGSSLMLVTKQWSNWPAGIKYLAILSYTAAIYIFAGFADKRLGLRSTGNVLRALCILLLPVMMLGLGWVATQPSTTGLPVYVEVAMLFLPATFLLLLASRNILQHFLRGHQLTFLACYAVLAIAGCLPYATDPRIAMVYLSAFWTVMTLGVVKVNRHVFWLTEEHRLPRIFGFFPILLLGAQFLMLSGTKVLFAVPPQWLGLSTVMLAATVLATSRSIASVFRARTGDLVRPLPWSIALPLFVGVLLAFAGVCISFWGFSFAGPTTYAVVPTAIVATVLLFVVAYDTRHWAFTALALILMTVAYQCAPTLIVEWINMLKAGAASAVHEEKLPIAFYGITYLPLLALLTSLSCSLRRSRRLDMSNPIQIFVTGITCLLWSTSLFHTKAILIVAAINVVAFIVYAIAFRDRRYVVGALTAIVLCSASWVPFLNSFSVADLGPNCMALSLLAVGLVFYISSIWDSFVAMVPLPAGNGRRLFLDSEDRAVPIVNNLGLIMLAALGCIRIGWLAWNSEDLASPLNLSMDLLLVAAFSLISFRSQHYMAALASAIVPALSALSYARFLGLSWSVIFDTVAMLAAIVSIAGLIIVRWTSRGESELLQVRTSFGQDLSNLRFLRSSSQPQGTSSRLFQWLRCQTLALSDVGTSLIVLLALCWCVPQVLVGNVPWLHAGQLHIASTIAIGWLAASALLIGSKWGAGAFALIAPLYTTAAINSYYQNLLPQEWVLGVWAVVASAVCLVCHSSGKSHLNAACLFSRIWLCVIALVGLVYLSVPTRIAVAIAIATLVVARGNILIRGERFFLAILCNVHALLLVANFAGLQGWIVQPYTLAQVMAIGAALFPAIVLSILVSDIGFQRISALGSKCWSTNLRIFAIVNYVTLCAGNEAPMSAQLLVLLGIAIAFVGEYLEATRSQSQFHAWSTLATVGLGILWGWDQGLLAVGTGWSQLIVIATAATSMWLAKVVRRHQRLISFAMPLKIIALVVPGIVAILAVVYELAAGLLVSPATSHSFNYIALLGAAALYFFHGLSNGKRRYLVLAGGILNLGLSLLWFSNGLTDPQFYCVPIGLSILWLVELLKKELPRKTHDALRYVGALVILVSPVFGILGSSWLHLFSLMVLCVVIILLAIGLRIRVLMYTGTAFLLADLCGMLIRSTIDNPTLLWVGGVGLGGAVIALAAVCENHRENVLAKIRLLSAELATWN